MLSWEKVAHKCAVLSIERHSQVHLNACTVLDSAYNDIKKKRSWRVFVLFNKYGMGG